jgi:hypothetical protein
MKNSEQIDKIAIALSELQGKMFAVGKSASNPFYRSKYTPLEDIVESLRPHLKEFGLSFTQFGQEAVNGGWMLVTKIMHKSGQWIEGYFPLVAVADKNGVVTPQAWGSAQTYARRYGLQAAFGITTGEIDDDGNLASGISPSKSESSAEWKDELTALAKRLKQGIAIMNAEEKEIATAALDFAREVVMKNGHSTQDERAAAISAVKQALGE